MACGKKHKRTGSNGKGKKIGIPIEEYRSDYVMATKTVAREVLEKLYSQREEG